MPEDKSSGRLLPSKNLPKIKLSSSVPCQLLSDKLVSSSLSIRDVPQFRHLESYTPTFTSRTHPISMKHWLISPLERSCGNTTLVVRFMLLGRPRKWSACMKSL